MSRASLVPLVLTLALAADAARAQSLALDRIDVAPYATRGVIDFAFDLLDPDGRRIAPDTVKVFADERPVPGAWTLDAARGPSRPIGLAIVIAAHRGYWSEVDPEGGLREMPGREIKRGWQSFLRSGALGRYDRSFAVMYNEDTATALGRTWTQDHEGLAGPEGELAEIPEKRERPDDAPRLYDAIARALDAFEGANLELPRRRVLLIVSDGVDRAGLLDGDEVASTLARRANGLGVRVHVLGFTLGAPQPLVDLGQLARMTHGTYVEVPFERHTELAAITVAFGQRVLAQPRLVFCPSPLWRPSAGPMEVELSIELAGGWHRSKSETVTIPPRAPPSPED